ncbi:Retinol dehydrogenase 12 isoform B [Micractinium conductrix]|uniref:Retinol dehydrogenase 12 isoform B n=1 Tax=Micractinium conductrix TaxID=554055 RepID=A0A2P6VM09_9CHLO|nr:Retinol dehydrogenase 12 isoform B [Micractinium conductrix]|eukprot:PSC75141.1 Retinol dehydrogenase 12 isoform B [Micractinium conductrix]
MPDLRGKTALITGASAGIGEAVAQELAGMGASVVLGVRSAEKDAATLARIMRGRQHREAYPEARVEVGPLLDLGRPDSIRAFAAEWCRSGRPLHILINNAGAYTTTRHTTPEGVAELCQVNYLGAYLLTRLLEGVLVASAPARVVTVTSVTHRMGWIDGADVKGDFLCGPGGHFYWNTKLANTLFAFELQRQLGKHGVQSCALDPGGVASDVWRHANKLTQAATAALYAPPEGGAEIVLHAAVAPWSGAGDRVGDGGRGELRPEEDLRLYTPPMFASPIVSWYGPKAEQGPLGRAILRWFGLPFGTPWAAAKQGAWLLASLLASVTDWPLRRSDIGAFQGARLAPASPLSYDARLAAVLWDASADVAAPGAPSALPSDLAEPPFAVCDSPVPHSAQNWLPMEATEFGFQHLREALPSVVDGLEAAVAAPRPEGPSALEAYQRRGFNLQFYAAFTADAGNTGADPAGCEAFLRVAASLGPRTQRLLSQLQATPAQFVTLWHFAMLSQAITFVLHKRCWEAHCAEAAGLPHATREDVMRCGVMDAAARLLPAVTAGGVLGSVWDPAALFGVVTYCAHMADEVRHHLRFMEPGPYADQLWAGVARTEVHARFAHAVLQAAIALQAHQGAPDRFEDNNGWARILTYMCNIIRRDPPRECRAWMAMDPGAMQKLARTAVDHLGTLARQAQRPMDPLQLRLVAQWAQQAGLVVVPEEDVEEVTAVVQRLADPNWVETIRAVDVLGGSAATAMLILNLAAEHWRADPGSAVRHALDLLAALPGRVPQRVPAGASAQVYCRALVSAYGAVLPILHGYFTGAAALAASIELESTVGDSPLAADARSDLSLMWLYLLESAKHLSAPGSDGGGRPAGGVLPGARNRLGLLVALVNERLNALF